jgi:uncharacterized protein YegL
MTPVRLTVFILVDTSGSMAGEPMCSLLRHLRLLKNEMSNHQLIRDRVDICLLGFGSEARLLADPASVADIEFPAELEAAGSTATGEAIGLMLEKHGSLQAATATPRLPSVALLVSDGVATDDFDLALARMDAVRWSARVAWALPGADLGQLERFLGEPAGRFSHLSHFDQGADGGSVSRFCVMLCLILGSQDSGDIGPVVPVKRGPESPAAGKAF